MRNKWKALVSAIAVAAVIGGGSYFAMANATTLPYEVTPTAIIFQNPIAADDHVNVNVDGKQYNWHFEAKCIDKTDHECANVRHARVGLTLHQEAQFIGKKVVPLPLKEGQCIKWVQWSQTNYHFGEQGEKPVCVPTVSTPEPPTAVAPVFVNHKCDSAGYISVPESDKVAYMITTDQANGAQARFWGGTTRYITEDFTDATSQPIFDIKVTITALWLEDPTVQLGQWEYTFTEVTTCDEGEEDDVILPPTPIQKVETASSGR